MTILDSCSLWLALDMWARGIIGVSFVAVSVHLFILKYMLGELLLFKRTVFMFALFIGLCGISRLCSCWEIFYIRGHYPNVTISPFHWFITSSDSVVAIVGLAAACALIPLTLNSMGWHIHLKKL